MSQQDDELSDDQLDSLLADLESRSDSSAGGTSSGEAASAGDDEDLQAFFDRVDAGDSSDEPTSKVATKDADDDLSAQFDALGNLQADDLPAKTSEDTQKGGGKTSAPKSTEAGQSDAARPSRAARAAKIAAKWAAFSLPVIALIWVVGAFLANWISAGWLIGLVAIAFGLGVPLAAKRLVKRGRFMWWTAGVGVVMTVGLTVPMPQQAGETLAKYGHWPARAVSDVVGWAGGNTLVDSAASVAGFVGGLVAPSDANMPPAAEIGTDDPIEQPTHGTSDSPNQPGGVHVPETAPSDSMTGNE